jgi:hypothetical protein
MLNFACKSIERTREKQISFFFRAMKIFHYFCLTALYSSIINMFTGIYRFRLHFHRTCIFLAFPFLILILGTSWDNEEQQDIYARKLSKLMRSVQFEDGDIIFRRGKSLASQAVLLTEKNSMYSHAGLICMLKDVPYVIHAVPGESMTEPEEIKFEKLVSFLGYEHASRAGVYRLIKTCGSMRSLAVNTAKQAFDQRVQFDEEYNLNSDDKLYCTELIWKSYRAAGIDLINGHFDALNIPLYKGWYILPGSLLDSKLLTEIYTY